MRNFSLNSHASTLLNQDTFYKVFERDLHRAKRMVLIESPFITQKRITALLPILCRLKRRGATVVVNTKPLDEHDSNMAHQAELAIEVLQGAGVIVLMTTGHHRKIAIVDDVLYEGSLNILSQNDSCEMMRRISDTTAVCEMLRFIGLEKWCK